ncbi:hypothetical protein FG386_001127 [Cryptosporidium ryanae]|uniref:uncharacterized protein n=1 Tax=Cryptosporidium ryanae TaxID=515981 RepID=UPI00351A2823|nr:hypothetical protein FG386_001127 [Cryptosporidium ryanae]
MDRQFSEKEQEINETESYFSKKQSDPHELDISKYAKDSKNGISEINKDEVNKVKNLTFSEEMVNEKFNKDFGELNSKELDNLKKYKTFCDQHKIECISEMERKNSNCETKTIGLLTDSELTKNGIDIVVNKEYGHKEKDKFEFKEIIERIDDYNCEVKLEDKLVESYSVLGVTKSSLNHTEKIVQSDSNRNYIFGGSGLSIRTNLDVQDDNINNDESDILLAKKFGSINKLSGSTKENTENEYVNNNIIVDRKEELKALKEKMERQKKEPLHELTDKVMEKKVCSGHLFRKDIFEELVEYLIEKRILTEVIFESKNINNEIEELESVNYLKENRYNTNNEENCKLFQDRRTFFENFLKFSSSRMPISKFFNNKIEINKNSNISNIKSFMDLKKNNDNIIFMEDCSDEAVNDISSQGLLPVNCYRTSIIYDNGTHIKERYEKVMQNFQNISNFMLKLDYNEYITGSLLKNMDTKVENSIKYGETNCKINGLDMSFFNLIKIVNNRLIKYDNNSLLQYSGELIELSLNLNGVIGNFINPFPLDIITRIINFQRRVDLICKRIGPSHEKGSNVDLSIMKRLISLENILDTMYLSEFRGKTLEQKVFMGIELLYGFSISDSRKSDLKKISNLVKSKVSSHIGRNINTGIEGFEDNSSEIETCNKADSIEMKNIIDELYSGENNLVSLLEDLLCIWSNILKGNNQIEQYLKCVESINSWEETHRGNLNNLEKIKNTIDGFKISIDNGIEILNSLYDS